MTDIIKGCTSLPGYRSCKIVTEMMGLVVLNAWLGICYWEWPRARNVIEF